QIKRKAILTDGLFALVQKNAGCDAGAFYPAYAGTIGGSLFPHIRQIQQRIRFPQIVHLRASRNLKTHLLIEPNRLLILLINIGCQFRGH
ncbi:disulfide interchange DsbA domain protein, partial [Escherichia coli 90.0091]